MKKISEMSTREGTRVLGSLATQITKIAGDKKFIDRLTEVVTNYTESTVVEQIGVLCDVLLSEYPQVLMSILSAVTQKPLKEVEEQPILETIAQVYELASDKQLIDFFTLRFRSALKTLYGYSQNV